MIGLIFVFAAITWPSQVEVSNGAVCQVVFTAKTLGACEAARERKPGIAYFWRTCIDVQWWGRGPNGQDIVKPVPIWAGNSRAKAAARCEKGFKELEKARERAHHR